jgi:beta-glucosidase/6-phospho-beta-glucosidase/beta-galactosidase
MQHFMFATGIENSCPAIVVDGVRKRVDEMESCGHYRRWRDDFSLVQELGIEYLRYGPPYFSVHSGPDRYDWSFADETFNALHDLGIVPIADLCHFGVPDWIGDFQNREWPELFADYARAFAVRFPWVRYYTPVNEIYIAALFSAQYGWWNERETSDRTFVRALVNLCRANTLAMKSILGVQPEAVFIQSESSEYFHPERPSCQARAAFLNAKRFLSLDLTYGYPLAVTMYEYLLDNGITREEYHWFLENHVKTRCVMGNDYYVTNEHLVHEDGNTSPAGEIFGYYVITRQYFSRYRLPVMHTETNLGDAERAPGWLQKEWANMIRLRDDGVPILGFTWYSLNDQMDWDSALRDDAGHVIPCGLADLDRRIRPVGHAYKSLIDMWREVLPTHSRSLSIS